MEALQQTNADIYARPSTARVGTAWVMINGAIYLYDHTRLEADLSTRKTYRAIPSKKAQQAEWSLIPLTQVIREYQDYLRG